MGRIYEFYKKYCNYILFGILFLLMIISEVIMFIYFYRSINLIENDNSKYEEVTVEPLSEVKQVIVDIKGEVKNPGVYTLDEGKRVIDVIKKAGGLTKNASTTVNNLSLKIFDEMVIVIYSKNEIEDYLNVKEQEENLVEKCDSDLIKNDSCVSNDSISTNKDLDEDENTDDESEQKLVSINSGTKEELMSIPGIGEAKADSIIEYRKENKFEKIEDIKNVSGIGEALFEKIKDYITT